MTALFLFFHIEKHQTYTFDKIRSKIRIYNEGGIVMNNFSEDLRKLLLVGIGAVAITAEKSKEVVEDLVKKGELTVEQGKVLNEELKHNVAEKLRQPVSVETVEQDLQKMDVDDLEKLKQKIEELQKSKNESK